MTRPHHPACSCAECQYTPDEEKAIAAQIGLAKRLESALARVAALEAAGRLTLRRAAKSCDGCEYDDRPSGDGSCDQSDNEGFGLKCHCELRALLPAQPSEATPCKCGHTKAFHRVCSDHDECVANDCQCCEWRPAQPSDKSEEGE